MGCGCKKSKLVSSTAVPQNTPTGMSSKKIGPGTVLKSLWAKAEMPPCDACAELAVKMDEWGPDGCREHLDEIVNDILPRAKEWIRLNRPWTHRVFVGAKAIIGSKAEDAALKYFIGRDVLKAIEESEKTKPRPVAENVDMGTLMRGSREAFQRASSRQRKGSDAVKPFLIDREETWKTDNAIREKIGDLLLETTILVKSFKRHDALLRFVQSVRNFYPTISICVADDSFQNGETNDTAEKIKSMPNIQWIQMPYDSGLCAGRNAMVKAATTQYVILCDDDFIFEEKTDLGALLLPLPETDLDICGGLVRRDGKTASNWCGNFIWPPGPDHVLRMSHPLPIVELSRGIRFMRCDVTYNFFAARRQFLINHPWDETFKITQEHTDSFLTWKLAGAKVGFTIDCICGHTKHYNGDDYRKYRTRDFSQYFHRKWQIASRKLNGITQFSGL
jgi:hypothetical protein